MRPDDELNELGTAADSLEHRPDPTRPSPPVIDADMAHHLALEARIAVAVRDIRLLSAVSWPAELGPVFLEGWHAGRPRLPEVAYASWDFAEARLELDRIIEASSADHPLGEYVIRTAESWHVAAELLEGLGTERVPEASTRLFGRPGDALPGAALTNCDAANHFIAIADELGAALVTNEADYCLSAQIMQTELTRSLDEFFGAGMIRVEVDPHLISKAAAGSTRVRLRDGTCFSEYDRHQLLQHEAFVHSLTALNGRAQPHLATLGRSAPRITATQEGLATFAELITGTIDIQRLKRISLRILAIELALSGADFIEVFKYFLDAGQTENDSFTSAQRVFRGCPLTGGAAFTKDTVYLHGLLAVHTFFRWSLARKKMHLTRLLFAGKMALQDVFLLEPLFESGLIAEPQYLPPWIGRSKGLAGVLAFSLFANRIRLDEVKVDDFVLGL